MSDIQEPEPVDPRDETDGVPLCTGCGRPYARDQYYCQYCGAGVGNRTPYLPYVNIPFNYAPAARSIGNLMKGRERRVWVVILTLLVWAVVFPLYVVAAPFILVEWLRSRKKRNPKGASDAPPDDDRGAPG